jgi:hypothetical protein
LRLFKFTGLERAALLDRVPDGLAWLVPKARRGAVRKLEAA